MSSRAGSGFLVRLAIWFCSTALRILSAKPRPHRELIKASYIHADYLLKLNEGWRLAPEEDGNREFNVVWLERDVLNDWGSPISDVRVTRPINVHALKPRVSSKQLQ